MAVVETLTSTAAEVTFHEMKADTPVSDSGSTVRAVGAAVQREMPRMTRLLR